MKDPIIPRLKSNSLADSELESGNTSHLLKVCGMRYASNIAELASLRPDLMGFIFYKKSKRFVGDLDPQEVVKLTGDIRRVGVFVNETLQSVLHAVDLFQLDYVQLHGDETPEFAKKLAGKVRVIKVFSVSDDLPATKPFEEYADFFLFDTATSDYGGSGRQFQWKLLENYSSDVPFFLSGGIGLEEIGKIEALKISQLVGIDINSRVELKPGLKNIELVKKIKERL